MISLYKPYIPKKLPELENILYSGNLAYGKWGKSFENKLKKYLNNENVLAIDSYNSAMLVLLSTLNLKYGDKIIASPMSCLASNQPFATQGIKIIWADIDPLTGTLNPESVKSKITKDVKAIFHNHHCGYVGYIDEINNLGKEYGIPVVDDAIEAFGSKYDGKVLGSLNTDFTVFSFETVRFPNCISGGAIVFKDNQMYKKAKMIRDYGVNRTIFRDELGEISKDCDISLPGYGAKPNEINSYIGDVQIDNIDKIMKKQSVNSIKWINFFKNNTSANIIRPIKKSDPNYWIFGILAKNKEETILEMRKQGYYASGVHLNNNHYSIFKNNEILSGVNEFYSKFVAIPCGWWF